MFYLYTYNLLKHKKIHICKWIITEVLKYFIHLTIIAIFLLDIVIHNTFLYITKVQVSERVKVAQLCLTLQPHGLQPTRLLCPWNFPGKNTRVGGHPLLQGIFLIQGLNLGLLHCRQILYHLSHQGSIFLLYIIIHNTFLYIMKV